jgi:hypothetical protein
MTQSKSDGKSAEAKLVESPAKRQRDELNVYSPPESNRKRRVAEETSDSSSIQPIPSPSSPKVDEDDLPELGVHLDDFGKFEVQDSGKMKKRHLQRSLVKLTKRKSTNFRDVVIQNF